MVRQAAVHVFPHRGSPSTAHTRVRWQPYNASHPSIPPRSSPLAFFVTPASSAASTSPSPRAFPEPDRTRLIHNPPRESKLRDLQKSKFALTLVDQAVKSLCDIWPQKDIPSVFLTSGRPTVSATSGADLTATSTQHTACRNTQLPSPISPTTRPTPVVSPVAYQACSVAFSQPHCEAIPMKCFVHEVLRRSKTSGAVLQTALCYVEAIRSKVSDLVRKERLCFSSSSIVVSDSDRICQGRVGIDFETDLTPTTNLSRSDGSLGTVRIDEVSEGEPSFPTEPPDDDEMPAHKTTKSDKASLPPLPPLPSPLLCPRRTFLASLILASKFMQDRCYSNRAWAKLSGLPPREIGRCERALGEALDWRLWVGKLPAVQSASGRALSKCKSESDIQMSGIPPLRHTSSDSDPCSPGSRTAPLRRSATLPSGSLCMEGPQAQAREAISPTAYSSSPSTPGLSYSPTPTESSLGDRTIQMTTSMDLPTPPPGQFASFTGAQNDKVHAMLSVPLNGLYVYANSQINLSLPSLAQRIDSQQNLSHVMVASNAPAWMFNEA